MITLEEAEERKNKIHRSSLFNLKNYKDIIGVEIGVRFGANAKNILETYDVKKLYLIDPYPRSGIDHKIKEFTKEYLKDYNDKIEWIYKFSWDVVDLIPDELDFVYIDGDHRGESVTKDLKLYYPKVKNGGLFAGHDYNPDNPNDFDLVQAVNNFFEDKNYILHLSKREEFQDWDWWIIK